MHSNVLVSQLCAIWSSDNTKDIIERERVQKRFTRILQGLDGLSYKGRLDRLELFSLERRSLWRDLIEVDEIMSGIEQLDRQYVFPKIGESKTEGMVLM